MTYNLTLTLPYQKGKGEKYRITYIGTQIKQTGYSISCVTAHHV